MNTGLSINPNVPSTDEFVGFLPIIYDSLNETEP